MKSSTEDLVYCGIVLTILFLNMVAWIGFWYAAIHFTLKFW